MAANHLARQASGHPSARSAQTARALTISTAMLLAACASPDNREGKILDASAPYCEQMRLKDPGYYADMCESGSAWKQRAPREYEHADEIHSDDGGISGAFIEGLLGSEDKFESESCAYSARCQMEQRRSR